MKRSMYKQVGLFFIFIIMVLKNTVFFYVHSLVPFMFFFPSCGMVSWCDWVETSVQDSQGGNCPDGNWWSVIVLGIMWSFCSATALNSAMLAAVLSQRVVLHEHKKAQWKHDHYMYQVKLFSQSFVSWYAGEIPLKKSHIFTSLNLFKASQFEKNVFWSCLNVSIIGFGYCRPNLLDKWKIGKWINSKLALGLSIFRFWSKVLTVLTKGYGLSAGKKLSNWDAQNIKVVNCLVSPSRAKMVIHILFYCEWQVLANTHITHKGSRCHIEFSFLNPSKPFAWWSISGVYLTSVCSLCSTWLLQFKTLGNQSVVCGGILQPFFGHLGLTCSTLACRTQYHYSAA